jgi:hypothetical protein
VQSDWSKIALLVSCSSIGPFGFLPALRHHRFSAAMELQLSSSVNPADRRSNSDSYVGCNLSRCKLVGSISAAKSLVFVFQATRREFHGTFNPWIARNEQSEYRHECEHAGGAKCEGAIIQIEKLNLQSFALCL